MVLYFNPTYTSLVYRNTINFHVYFISYNLDEFTQF